MAFLKTFHADQSGITTTEYLVALGLLTGAVIVSVVLFGDAMSASWLSWGSWMEEQPLPPPPS